MSATPGPAAGWGAAALQDLERMSAGRGCRHVRDEPLSRHTSMGIGGPCPLMVWPRRPADVRALAAWMGERGLGWRVLGGGTNLLVDDAGVDDVVLATGDLDEGDRYDTDGARFPAGISTARALRRTARRGLEGLVWAAGLPGSIGGAAAGNAGCWGGEMADVVAALEVVDGQGHAHQVSADALGWEYRNLTLPAGLPGPWTIVGVRVRLRQGDAAALESRYLELQARKRETQPVGARNSGCVFRNPDGEQSAGRLIDRAGCKGLEIGGASISPVHANFVINRGDATAADVDRLVSAVERRVRERFGIRLRTEIRRW